MIPLAPYLALQIALWALWAELFGADPARLLREAADALDRTKPHPSN